MTRSIARLAAAFMAGAALTDGARAEAPEAQIPASEKPTITFGADKADCLEWSDGCVTCRKQADGEAACSTPGIACLPTEPSCTRLRRAGGG